MDKRINIADIEPRAYKAISGLERFVDDRLLSPVQQELIKIRASQINGCEYCIGVHSDISSKAGESERRIEALSSWRKSSLFSEEEKAFLALTEEITLISKNGVSKHIYDEVVKYWGEDGAAQIIMHIVNINTWNRIALTTNMH